LLQCNRYAIALIRTTHCDIVGAGRKAQFRVVLTHGIN
jgi:hypothetical protein